MCLAERRDASASVVRPDPHDVPTPLHPVITSLGGRGQDFDETNLGGRGQDLEGPNPHNVPTPLHPVIHSYLS